MESQDIAILFVVLIVIGVVAYIVYTNFIQPPQTESRETQTGELEAPTPFNPLGKSDALKIVITPGENMVCGNAGPVVAF